MDIDVYKLRCSTSIADCSLLTLKFENRLIDCGFAPYRSLELWTYSRVPWILKIYICQLHLYFCLIRYCQYYLEVF